MTYSYDVNTISKTITFENILILVFKIFTKLYFSFRRRPWTRITLYHIPNYYVTWFSRKNFVTDRQINLRVMLYYVLHFTQRWNPKEILLNFTYILTHNKIKFSINMNVPNILRGRYQRETKHFPLRKNLNFDSLVRSSS